MPQQSKTRAATQHAQAGGAAREAVDNSSGSNELPQLHGDFLNLMMHVERMVNNKFAQRDAEASANREASGGSDGGAPSSLSSDSRCESRRSRSSGHPEHGGDDAISAAPDLEAAVATELAPAVSEPLGQKTPPANNTPPRQENYCESAVMEDCKPATRARYVSEANSAADTCAPDSSTDTDVEAVRAQRPTGKSVEPALSDCTSFRRSESSLSLKDRIVAKVEMRRKEVQETGHRLHWLAMKFEIGTCILFIAACSVVTTLWVVSDNSDAYVITVFVTAIAACAYLAKSNHMGDFKIKDVDVPIARYLDWLITTPLMLYELCHLAHATASTTMWIVGCDVMMLGCGMIAAVIDWQHHKIVKHVWFCVACIFYVLLVFALQTDVTKMATKQNDKVQDLFAALKWLTIFTWTFYPLVVILGRAHLGVISRATEDILLCILDVCAKIGMDGFIVGMCHSGCIEKYPAGDYATDGGDYH